MLGVDHVQLAAPPGCEPGARHFYGDLLGLAELTKPESLRARGGVWFRVGPQQLHIGVEAPFSPARKAHPALRVSEDALELIAGRLAAAQARVVWNDDLPGVRRFYTEDPWGNRLELLAHASPRDGGAPSGGSERPDRSAVSVHEHGAGDPEHSQDHGADDREGAESTHPRDGERTDCDAVEHGQQNHDA
jgi:catechol 2,3-dioxygenase-like lactoylglutathione lyase family enzyme